MISINSDEERCSLLWKSFFHPKCHHRHHLHVTYHLYQPSFFGSFWPIFTFTHQNWCSKPNVEFPQITYMAMISIKRHEYWCSLLWKSFFHPKHHYHHHPHVTHYLYQPSISGSFWPIFTFGHQNWCFTSNVMFWQTTYVAMISIKRHE